MSCDIGLYGLAVMGQNFALNMAQHGFKVCVGNRSQSKVTTTVERAKQEGNLPIIGSDSPKQFIEKLKEPRKVIILVQAGKPVDETIAKLSKYMEPGDLIVDGGNEWFPNSIRRAEELEKKGIMFIGMGISGGEEGARNGPSLMPGGPKKAYDMMETILLKSAAQAEGEPCTGYLGPIGAGNYVKMVHNGIEYGDMQLIAEVYDIMRTVLGYSNQEMAKIFEQWNTGDLESFLIEITATILSKEDSETGKGNIVDYILDKTGMKVRLLGLMALDYRWPVSCEVAFLSPCSANLTQKHLQPLSFSLYYRVRVVGLCKRRRSKALLLPPLRLRLMLAT
jgi:6-phosphogluconate dehydrogenase